MPLSDSEEEKVVEDGYGVAKDAAEGDKGDLGYRSIQPIHPISFFHTDPLGENHLFQYGSFVH